MSRGACLQPPPVGGTKWLYSALGTDLDHRLRATCVARLSLSLSVRIIHQSRQHTSRHLFVRSLSTVVYMCVFVTSRLTSVEKERQTKKQDNHDDNDYTHVRRRRSDAKVATRVLVLLLPYILWPMHTLSGLRLDRPCSAHGRARQQLLEQLSVLSSQRLRRKAHREPNEHVALAAAGSTRHAKASYPPQLAGPRHLSLA